MDPGIIFFLKLTIGYRGAQGGSGVFCESVNHDPFGVPVKAVYGEDFIDGQRAHKKRGKRSI